MRIRFQADADLNQVILLATLRREPAIDFQTAAAADLAHRRNRAELYLRSAMEVELPIEPELERWYPLWGVPL